MPNIPNSAVRATGSDGALVAQYALQGVAQAANQLTNAFIRREDRIEQTQSDELRQRSQVELQRRLIENNGPLTWKGSKSTQISNAIASIGNEIEKEVEKNAPNGRVLKKFKAGWRGVMTSQISQGIRLQAEREHEWHAEVQTRDLENIMAKALASGSDRKEIDSYYSQAIGVIKQSGIQAGESPESIAARAQDYGSSYWGAAIENLALSENFNSISLANQLFREKSRDGTLSASQSLGLKKTINKAMETHTVYSAVDRIVPEVVDQDGVVDKTELNRQLENVPRQLRKKVSDAVSVQAFEIQGASQQRKDKEVFTILKDFDSAVNGVPPGQIDLKHTQLLIDMMPPEYHERMENERLLAMSGGAAKTDPEALSEFLAVLRDPKASPAELKEAQKAVHALPNVSSEHRKMIDEDFHSRLGDPIESVSKAQTSEKVYKEAIDRLGLSVKSKADNSLIPHVQVAFFEAYERRSRELGEEKGVRNYQVNRQEQADFLNDFIRDWKATEESGGYKYWFGGGEETIQKAGEVLDEMGITAGLPQIQAFIRLDNTEGARSKRLLEENGVNASTEAQLILLHAQDVWKGTRTFTDEEVKKLFIRMPPDERRRLDSLLQKIQPTKDDRGGVDR